MTVEQQVKKVKLASPLMAGAAVEVRNKALALIARRLEEKREEIFAANAADMAAAREAGIDAPVLKRLRFDEGKLTDVIQGIQDLIAMADPLFRTQLHRQLDEGLVLKRISCPIGVIGVIFEARPDALVQISALCIKSGNCAIIKGGSEAKESNRRLFSIIYEAALEAGLPDNCMLQLEGRSEISELLNCAGLVDLLIPRGSNAFVQYIMNNTRIPVMGHADGICHIYVDRKADVDKAVRIIVDAKTQYVSACNTVETLLIHEDVAETLVPALYKALKEKYVRFKGDERIRALCDCEAVCDADDSTEYLDYILSARTVSDITRAIDHINRFGSHHTDAIITEDDQAAEQFMCLVDSAGVYRNCSTRFADGYRYGFGAEVGISTSKIHARGPVGLEGLISYKYRLAGDGHIVGDYAAGIRRFDFKEITE